MLKPLRLFLALATIAVTVWACFSVKLGQYTFAEHVDAISETPQARSLMEGTRETINPALDRAKERVLGEYVTAPTFAPVDVDAGADRLPETSRASIYAGQTASQERSPPAPAPAARTAFGSRREGPTAPSTAGVPGRR